MRDPAGAVAGRIFAFRDISAEQARRADEVRLRLDGLARAAHAADLDLRLRGDAAARRTSLFGEEERRTFLGYIASESERLTQIVDALLNVARLDTGDLAGQPRADRRRARRRRGRRTTCARPGDNGHGSWSTLPDEPLAAQADPEKLRQVLREPHRQRGQVLAGRRHRAVGARGATAHGRGQRRRRGHRHPGRRAGADLPEVLPRRRRTSRDGLGGTGLGLFIARGLVTAMGGRMWVDSREGEGVELRVRAADAARARECPSLRRAGRGSDDCDDDVLVIDDEAPIRLLCRVNLEAEGMDGARGDRRAERRREGERASART